MYYNDNNVVTISEQLIFAVYYHFLNVRFK